MEQPGQEGLKTPKTFRGDNHAPLFQINDDLNDTNWSTRSMSVEEMAELLGKIRNFTPMKK
jgi:hypothetical protein